MVKNSAGPDPVHDELELNSGHWMRILGPTGHTTVTWEYDTEKPVEDQEEVMIARLKFEEAIRNQKVAFRMNHAGTEGEPIREFDPAAEGILLVAAVQGG